MYKVEYIKAVVNDHVEKVTESSVKTGIEFGYKMCSQALQQIYNEIIASNDNNSEDFKKGFAFALSLIKESEEHIKNENAKLFDNKE